jgi:hypothetical protein
MARLNPMLAKLHRSYTVEEVARLFGTHRNTVRSWLKAGLRAIDDRRPLMIQGQALRAFLQARREAAKRPCSPGTLYCCKCRVPRRAAKGSAIFTAQTGSAGILRAICDLCGTRMFRRTRVAELGAIMPLSPVLIVQAERHIAECTQPFPNCAEERNGSA